MKLERAGQRPILNKALIGWVGLEKKRQYMETHRKALSGGGLVCH